MHTGEILIYQTEDGQTSIDVTLEKDTIWLRQEQIGELFDRDRPVTLFNLDVIISIGYRVKSVRGTQFRIWANKVLKDYLTKGFAINEKRVKRIFPKFAGCHLSDFRWGICL